MIMLNAYTMNAIRVNANLNSTLHDVLNQNNRDVRPVVFCVPVEKMCLSRDYRSKAKEMSECGGYSGHCSCLNNACMMCTSLH